jgi:hypothetical protein
MAEASPGRAGSQFDQMSLTVLTLMSFSAENREEAGGD